MDAATRLPIAEPVTVEVRGATIAGTPLDVALHEHAVTIRQNRSGQFVVFAAPFFDSLHQHARRTRTSPPETVVDPLLLHLAVTPAGAHYLPQEFQFALPRALDPEASRQRLSGRAGGSVSGTERVSSGRLGDSARASSRRPASLRSIRSPACSFAYFAVPAAWPIFRSARG